MYLPAVFLADAVANPQDLRERIERFEDGLKSRPQLDVPTYHTFGPGFYARTIELPAGAELTGRVHKTEHVFLLSKGILSVATEDGVQTLEAPAQFVCRAGLKRAGFAHTDVVCSNIHLTDETDLVKLEQMLVEPADALPAPDDQEFLP